MKTMFKPLGLAAAVAAASAGYAGIVNAQATLAGNSGLGDLAIVPYYQVQSGWSTGISVINTSDTLTQVVKLRLRRAADSMDALDFNVILSPNDVYTGYIQGAGDAIRFYSNDNSCTAPAYSDTTAVPYFQMPLIFREGADEGYIEVIAMAAAESSQPIAKSALHNSSGVPASCDRVRDNFFPGSDNSDYASTADLTRRGVIDSTTTHQYTSAAGSAVEANTYLDAPNSLKVSYFIKNDESATEFGNDAVHIADFMDAPSMTNQKRGFADGDLQGFDYPDLNGGAVYSATIDPVMGAAGRGKYEPLRDTLGALEVINDWSKNGLTTDLFTVSTDWVVTTPGQYLMTNIAIYGAGNTATPDETALCIGGIPGVDNYDSTDGANCDFRDIPMTATFVVYDREERGITIEESDLVVSPSPPGEFVRDVLDSEVNIISFGVLAVLDAARQIEVGAPAGAEAGWAKMSVSQWVGTEQAICDITGLAPGVNSQPTVAQPYPTTCVSTDTPVPLVGFVAWERNFGDDPFSNYGRIVEHSYTTSS